MSRDRTVKGRVANIGNLKFFQKGQSGNPSGRPKKIIDVAAIARDSSDKAMLKLAKLIDSEDERIALQAAIAVLDRAVGKPKQAIETTTKKEATDYTNAELLNIARMGSARTSAPQHGEREPDRIQ